MGRVIEGSVKHPRIKHVGRVMTLNLPQMLHDLNHHHHHSLFVSRSLGLSRSKTPRRRFLGLAATCRALTVAFYPISLSFRRLHLRSPPPSLRPLFHLPDTLFSHRSTIFSRFTAYRTLASRSLLSSLPHTATMFSPSLPVSLSPPFGRSLPQFQTCQFWFISTRSRTGYDLYVAVRRIATLPGLERPSPLIRSLYPKASRYFVLDGARRTLDSRVPWNSYESGGGRGINPRDTAG